MSLSPIPISVTKTHSSQNPGLTNVTLNGTLIPHTSQTDLATLSTLFTSYLNSEVSPVLAQGLSTSQSNGTAISWLSRGIQSLVLNVPFKSPSPINPIQAIDIGTFNLSFTPDTSWNPNASSNSVHATLGMFRYNLLDEGPHYA